MPPNLMSSSTFGVEIPAPSAGALRSSATSGSAAICLPNRPKVPISLPTSAAFEVLYWRHVPDSGSYVLRVNDVVGSSGDCVGGGDDVRDESAGLEACFSRYFWRFFIFEGVGFSTVYLEVMRVY